MEDLKIRPVTEEDAPAITGLYNPYITNTTITFEEEPVSAEEMLQRIHKVLAIPFPWLCAEVNGRLAGYAYAARWRERGLVFLHAPVFMAPSNAQEGSGIMLLSGDKARCDALLPALQAMTGKVVWLGEAPEHVQHVLSSGANAAVDAPAVAFLAACAVVADAQVGGNPERQQIGPRRKLHLQQGIEALAAQLAP